MNTLYLDIFSGISGDLFLGAMLDLGLDFNHLEQELAKLRLGGYHLHTARRQKSGIEGVKFDVHLEADHRHGHDFAPAHDHPKSHNHHGHSHSHSHSHRPAARTFAQIRRLIQESSLSDWVRQKAVAVFEHIAVAEGKIHGQSPEEVHFHEVGAVDSIVDIVGACIALEAMGRPQVLAARVVEGTGWVECAHGRLPIPAPATLEILGRRGIAITQCEEPHELVTPTGAALLAEFVTGFGTLQEFTPARVGYGLGTRDNRTRPNVLRALLGTTVPDVPANTPASHDWETDTVAILQSNLDDISPEILGRFVEVALAAGALDVFYTPIHMKKNRPGVLLTILCATEQANRFSELILRETTAFGVRRITAERRKLRREIVTVPTPYGDVEVKVGRLDGELLQAAPEYEACKERAEKAGVPVRKVFQAAVQALPR